MKTLSGIASSVALCAAYLLSSPETFAQKHTNAPSKLVIKKKETYTVGPDNILKVDTLIMHDKATIRFDPLKYAVIEAKVAIIGDQCLISTKGKDGKKGTEHTPGGNGEHGGNLSVNLNFNSLGKLTIDTRGGNGGAGANGRNGQKGMPESIETRTVTDVNGKQQTITVVVPAQPGSNGTDATMGGNGGNGGNVLLTYRTSGFIPVFNQESRNPNSIIILHTAGQQGVTGEPGKGGIAKMDGVVKFSEVKIGTDGRVELVNLDTLAN